jgi:hypothetical protein
VPEAPPIPLTEDEKQTVVTTVAHVQAFAGVLRVDRLFAESDLTTILTEVFVAASGEYGIRAAQEWAGGYTFPQTLLTRDEDAFAKAGNLQEFSRQRQQLLDHERINLTRVHECFGTEGTRVPDVRQSDFRHLCTVAEKGIQLHLPAYFTPTSSPPPLQTKYEQVAPAVHKMLAA